MAVEKKWLSVTTTPFTSNGTQFGVVTVADTAGFKVKGLCFLAGNSPLTVLQLQVQRVLSPTQLIVGPPGSTPDPSNFTDISAYTVSQGAVIGFPEQSKNKIKPDDIEQATYEADPTVAWRVTLVDQYGRFYSVTNPIPIIFDGTVSIGDIAIVAHPNAFWDQVAGSITSAANTTIYTFTSSDDNTTIVSLETTVSTPAFIQVILDGNVIRSKWTSPLERNVNFKFEEPRKIPNGKTLVVKAQVERFIWPTYETFVSWEGYVGDP
jgi:hypothetical protein